MMAFFTLWTRKEALLKATGQGLGKPLSLVEVSFVQTDAARVIAIDDRVDAAARWRLEHLSPRAGFVGAVAIERPDVRVLPCQSIADPADLQQGAASRFRAR